MFLALQGVLLKIIGEGGTIAIRDSKLLAINNNTMPVWLGWTLYVVIIGVYAAISLRRAATRRAGGLQSEGVSVVIAKVVVLAIAARPGHGLPVPRAQPQPAVSSIKGVPEVVLLLLILLVGLTFVLGRTAFGRHVYAVGGNAEAARRAGINVKQIKLFCFVICSTLAAVGGILLASRDNSISPTTGGAETLLYAVGAAVIGGTSLFGGKGKILDAVLGGLVIAVIINGMGLLNQPSERGLHRHRRGAAHRGQRGRAVPAAGAVHGSRLTGCLRCRRERGTGLRPAGRAGPARRRRPGPPSAAIGAARAPPRSPRRRSAGTTSACCCGCCTSAAPRPGPT